MTTTPAPTAPLSIRPGSAGRFYVLDGFTVVARCASEDEARQVLSFNLEGPDDDWAEWYCGHDVPNGCSACARARAEDAWYTRRAIMAEEAERMLDPKYVPYLDRNTDWGDANEMAMHAMEAWADREESRRDSERIWA
jgi:hypothetical protein